MDNESQHTKKLPGFQEVKVPVIRCVCFYVVDYLKIEEMKLC